jgi:DNA-binding NtrC family response regulator
LSLAGKKEEALGRVAAAERFFETRGLAPALSLCLWVKAEACFLAGDIDAASRHLEESGQPTQSTTKSPAQSPASDLTAALLPLLAARLLLEKKPGQEGRGRAADLLAVAGAALVRNAMPEWSSRLEVLRTALRSGGDHRSAARKLRRDLSAELPEDLRRQFLHASAWVRWCALPAPAVASPSGAAAAKEGLTTARTATRKSSAAAALSPSRARLVARSAAMRKLLSVLDGLQGSDLPVLVRGETGSGKEIVARAIHEESARRSGPFEVVDCAAIPAPLFESELFGARAGAYTGIQADRPGILELSSGGTVLLDEIAGMPLDAQAKLLRVLAAGTIRALGAVREKRIDVRFLFSTARDLDAEVKEGRFRRDVLHRIRVVTLDVPPLRERPEDFEDLTAALLAEVGCPRPAVGPGVVGRLRSMDWPGNVRELKNFLARLSLEHPEGITADAVDRARREPGTITVFPKNILSSESLADLHRRLERDYIAYHYKRLGGDTAAVCRFLKRGRRQFYRRCALLGIVLKDLREAAGSRRTGGSGSKSTR